MTETKKLVFEYERILTGSYEDVDISELIHKLKHLRSQGYSRVETDYKYLDKWDTEKTFIVRARKSRKETDKEYHARMEKEEQQKAESEEQRRKQYERLKREFDS
jgi:hypothetical protein